MKRKSFLIGLTVVLVAYFVFGIERTEASERPTPRDPFVTFAGFTNVPTKGKCALFALTNTTEAPLICVPEAIEQSTGKEWVRTPLVGKAMWQATRDWVGFQEELKPRQAFTFAVAGPSTNGSWRLVVRCQQRALIKDATVDLVRRVTSTNAAIAQSRQFSGKIYSVTTPAVGK